MVARGKRLSVTMCSSFGFAFRGLAEAFKYERNFRIQCFYLCMVGSLLLWLRPETGQTLVVMVSMTSLLSFELINSAIERTVDLACDDFHPLAGLAKDLSASAVLLIAIMTALVNTWVFGSLLSFGSQCALAALVTVFVFKRFTVERA